MISLQDADSFSVSEISGVTGTCADVGIRVAPPIPHTTAGLTIE